MSLLSYMNSVKENPPAILSASFYADTLSKTKTTTSLAWNQCYHATSVLLRSMSTSMLLFAKNLKENPPALLSASFYADFLSKTKATTSLVWNQYYHTTSVLLRSMSTSMILFANKVKENPPISFERIESSSTAITKCISSNNDTSPCNIIVLMNIPYCGVTRVPLDVFIFGLSAVTLRIYMFWLGRERRRTSKYDDDDYDYGKDLSSSTTTATTSKLMSPPVKAKAIAGYKDHALHQTIQECQNIKSKLRKVSIDPDVARREKQRKLRIGEMITALQEQQQPSDGGDGGYLGMTTVSLQKARMDLKHVPLVVTPDDKNVTTRRKPLSSKENRYVSTRKKY
jgi:hypothetical protein